MKYFRVLLAALQEIFDESAYLRFCAREHILPGRSSYKRFIRELYGSKPAKLKCC